MDMQDSRERSIFVRQERINMGVYVVLCGFALLFGVFNGITFYINCKWSTFSFYVSFIINFMITIMLFYEFITYRNILVKYHNEFFKSQKVGITFFVSI